MDMYVRPEQHETATAARKLFASALPNAWQERLDVGGDYGIDDHVEIFHRGRTTGLLLLVQRKGFAEPPPAVGVTEIAYDLPVRTLHYAELFSPPVLLVLVPVQSPTARFYYLWLQEYIRVRLDHENPTWRANKDKVRVRVPTANQMPGQEHRLAHIAAAPNRDRDWARAARIAHELGYAADAPDLKRVQQLIDELYQLESIFGDPGWTWSVWARTQVLDTAKAAVEALIRGEPFSIEDLAAAGSQYNGLPFALEEQELMRFVLESKVQLFPNQIGALISTTYDDALARLGQESFGDLPY